MNSLLPTRIAAPLRSLGLALALALAASVSLAAPAVGEQIRLSATMTDGGRVSLEEARGRRALLALWSPSSLAWRKSMGEFERFAASSEAAAVYLLAVSVDGDAASLRDFMTTRGPVSPLPGATRTTSGPSRSTGCPCCW
jgi:hypothetical protein